MTEAVSPIPLVSVVIPIYNHASYVGECLDSLARQTHSRIEVIAIDDGSADASLAVAQRWFSAHGHRFENWNLQTQSNVGITRTFNRLVAQSRGDFVFPLASDDMAAEDAIGALVAFYQAHCTEPTLLFSDVALIDQQGNPYTDDSAQWRNRNRELLAASPAWLGSELLFDWGTPFQHQFYPRALYQQLGGYDESLTIEDLAFALKACARKVIRYAPLQSRLYRVRPGFSATPGVTALDFGGMPSRLAVRSEFNLFGKLAIHLLNQIEKLPEGRRRRAARRRVRRLRRLHQTWLRWRMS